MGDLREVVTDIWGYRELLIQLAKRDIKIRYKQAVMGLGWALLMPMLIVLAGIIVRVAVATVSGDALDRTAIAALMLKGSSWAFFVGTIGFATASLTGNMNLVTKVYFPREVLPLSALVAQGFDSTIAGIVVLAALPILGISLTINALWAPFLIVCLIATTAAAALLLSCANLFFRDVKYIVQVLLTFGIFFTPVLYEPAMLGAQGASLVFLNPLSPLLEGLRLCLIEGHSLLEPLVATGRNGVAVTVWEPWYLAYAGFNAFVGLAVSSIVFHRAEFAFAEYV
jgi:ABC-type polysaccharide/polyol phosphate export permease